MKNVGFTTKLDLFSNYLKKPQNIDVTWEMLLTLKVNKYISVNLSTTLLYDDDTQIPLVDRNGTPELDANGNQKKAAKIQFKEILGVGLSCKF